MSKFYFCFDNLGQIKQSGQGIALTMKFLQFSYRQHVLKMKSQPYEWKFSQFNNRQCVLKMKSYTCEDGNFFSLIIDSCVENEIGMNIW